MRHSSLKSLGRAALVAIPVALALAAPAQAGRLVATGHDADHHCSGRDARPGQCTFFAKSLNYVRAGAPDPSKPVLVLDRGALDVVTTLDKAYGAGAVPRVVIDPRSEEFVTAPINTGLYSAVVIASSRPEGDRDTIPQDLNDRTTPTDSLAILARGRDLQAFYNQGGGIYAGSGNEYGDGPDDPYYGFLPLPVNGGTVARDFALTQAGIDVLGYSTDFTFSESDEINCCVAHNTFDIPPAGSALQVAEVDNTLNEPEGRGQRALTVFADTPNLADVGTVPELPAAATPPVNAGTVGGGGAVPSSNACLRRTRVSIKLKRPVGVAFRRAVVYVNGKKVRTLKGKKVTRRFSVKLKGNRTRVRIVVTTTGGKKVTVKRTYRRCR